MKIVFFRHSLLSRGGDKMIVAHASHLADVGHHVALKCARVDTVFPINPLIHLESLPFSGKLGTLLSAAMGRHDCDLIIADIIPLVCLLGVRNRKRVLYFAQDYDESYYSSHPMKLLIRCLYHFALRLFRVPVIAVSHHLADILKGRFNADVKVVENGVDTKVFFPDPDPELIASKGGRKAILLLSRSDWRKGFDLAQEVIRQLGQSQPVPYEIWTVGEDCSWCFKTAVHRDFGYVNEEKLRRIMSSADLFLYPSRHEGLPLMPMEAFACRCPVSTTEAVPFARHGENALVAKVEDVPGILSNTISLLCERDSAASLVARAEAAAASHSLERSLEQFENALRIVSPEGSR